MAKEAKYMKLRIEVAPPLVAFPEKCSTSPNLETIREERAEECDEDYDDWATSGDRMLLQCWWKMHRLIRWGKLSREAGQAFVFMLQKWNQHRRTDQFSNER